MTGISTLKNDDVTVDEIERRFDAGEDVLEFFDLEHPIVRRPDVRDDEQRQVNTTLPTWLVDFMDDEAGRRGISRKAVINNWLVDRADQERERRRSFA